MANIDEPLKISIVTPSYNSERFIERTILSVIGQSYSNCEYILVDGGSQDKTVSIIKKYEKKIVSWVSEPDEGQYHAIQKGLDRATGDILCWLNSDDMLLPEALSIVSSIFQQFPEVEWISTLKPGAWDANGYFMGYNLIPGFSRKAYLDGYYLPGTLKRGHYIQQESTFWRRSLWERSGAKIPEHLDLAGDFALWSRFYNHAELYGVDYPLAGFRLVQGQKSEAIEKYNNEARAVFHEVTLTTSDVFLRYARYSKLCSVPFLKVLSKRYLSYPAKKITNRYPKVINGLWSIESYSFLP